MNQKAVEIQSFKVSTAVNCFMGIAGLVVYFMTGLNALLLDGVFSLIAFVSSLVGYFISQYSHKKTKSFPYGLYFLEPLYAVFKSIATLTLLLVTLVDTSKTALHYWLTGNGELMETGPVIPYTILMVIICFSLSYYNRRQNARIGNLSTMIAAESKGNFVDGVISAGVGIAIFMLYFVDVAGPLSFLHYTGDFFITVVLVLISYREPINALVYSFKELAQSQNQDESLQRQVQEIVADHLADPENDLTVMIFKQGMHLIIRLHLPNQHNQTLLDQLVASKDQVHTSLQENFERVRLEILL